MKSEPVARIKLKLMNRCEIVISKSVWEFDVFQKVPVIIIFRFRENNVFDPIYIILGMSGVGGRG